MVVIDDGENGWKCIATAIHLAETGHSVAITTPHAEIGTGLGPMAAGPAIRKLFALGVELMPYFILKELSEHKLMGVHAVSEVPITYGPFDAVITSFYNKANDSLYLSLKGQIEDLYRIGDCLAPRRVLDAIREGASYGRAI
jgi:hypothetical protein